MMGREGGLWWAGSGKAVAADCSHRPNALWDTGKRHENLDKAHCESCVQGDHRAGCILVPPSWGSLLTSCFWAKHQCLPLPWKPWDMWGYVTLQDKVTVVILDFCGIWQWWCDIKPEGEQTPIFPELVFFLRHQLPTLSEWLTRRA